MKKVMLFQFFMVGLIGLTSCSKDTELVTPEEVKTSKAQAEDLLLDEILWVMENWDEYTGTVSLFIKSDPDDPGLGWNFNDAGNTNPPQSAIVCEGSGISFAKCVKNWLEENPERCLKVSVNGSTFSADDDCEM